MRRFALYSLFVINLFIILGFWWSNSGSFFSQGTASSLIALGRLSGLAAVYFVLLQFLLIGRGVWIERVFGLDKLSRVHHLNAFLTISFILLHPILLTIGYSLDAKINFINQFIIFITSYNDVLWAFLAVLLFILIIFFSFYIIRNRLKYESWYFIHLFTYLAVFLAWGHQLKIGKDFESNNFFVYYWSGLYIFVLGNHFVFRFIRPWYFFNRHRFFVEKVAAETHDTISVYISGKKMEGFRPEPGQFCILRFFTKSLWWQAHPFSLSEVASGKNIRFTIKNVGDFTSEIPKLRRGTPVVIDGPYGTFTKKAALRRKILLIAGGIGITPIRSLLEQMVSEGRDIVLLYSNKSKDDIVFKKEIDALAKRYTFRVYNVLSREKHSDFLYGRIDDEMIKRFVKDVGEREIYICGPVPMMEAVKRDLIGLGVPKDAIHYEKFSL